MPKQIVAILESCRAKSGDIGAFGAKFNNISSIFAFLCNDTRAQIILLWAENKPLPHLLKAQTDPAKITSPMDAVSGITPVSGTYQIL